MNRDDIMARLAAGGITLAEAPKLLHEAAEEIVLESHNKLPTQGIDERHQEEDAWKDDGASVRR
jgi:hypothetical protein